MLCVNPRIRQLTCKLQVSMTWALKPSDKAVTANSESAFSVGELNFSGIINAWPQLHKKIAQPTNGYLIVLMHGQ